MAYRRALERGAFHFEGTAVIACTNLFGFVCRHSARSVTHWGPQWHSG